MIEFTSQQIQRINPSLLQQELDSLFSEHVPFTYQQVNDQLEWLRIEVAFSEENIASILDLLAAHDPDAFSLKQVENQTIRADLEDRYSVFEGETFATSIQIIENWKAATGAALNSAGTLAEVRTVLINRLGQLVDFLAPAMLWTLKQYRQEQDQE